MKKTVLVSTRTSWVYLHTNRSFACVYLTGNPPCDYKPAPDTDNDTGGSCLSETRRSNLLPAGAAVIYVSYSPRAALKTTAA